MTQVEPQLSPAPSCPKAQGCQITALTVSQLSGLLVLIVSVVVVIWGSFPDAKSAEKSATLLQLLSTVAYCSLVSYYVVGCWQLEEELFIRLVKLPRWVRILEITVRVSLLFIGIMSLSVYTQIMGTSFFTDPFRGNLFFCALMFWLFIVWDCVVAQGSDEGVEIAKAFFPYDALSFLLFAVGVTFDDTILRTGVMFGVLVVIGSFLLRQRQQLSRKFQLGIR